MLRKTSFASFSNSDRFEYLWEKCVKMSFFDFEFFAINAASFADR